MRRFWAATALGAILVASAIAGDAWAAGFGKTCGGRLAIRCDRGLFCEFSGGTCGAFDAEGTCVRVPRFCRQRITARPVCGCNDKTYADNCQRQQATVAKRRDGPC